MTKLMTLIGLSVSLTLSITAVAQQPQPMPEPAPYPGEPVPVPPSPSIWVGLGDSLMTGFNSEGLGNFPENSFGTGSHADSVMLRYSAANQRVVQGKNLAKPGALALALPFQLAGFKDDFLDHAVISIGANDLCHFGEGSLVVPSLAWTISELKRKNPNIKTIVVPVPNLEKVFKLSEDKPYCRRVWMLGMCPAFLGFWVSDAERAIRQGKVDALNEDLAALAGKFTSVVFASSYLDTEMEDKDISQWDCFHPSLEGHNRLANAVFADYQQHLFDAP